MFKEHAEIFTFTCEGIPLSSSAQNFFGRRPGLLATCDPTTDILLVTKEKTSMKGENRSSEVRETEQEKGKSGHRRDTEVGGYKELQSLSC